MKSISLDTLYGQLDKHILLAQAYTEIPELSFIIKGCRLKPYDYFFGNQEAKIVLHRWWFDEWGSSLNIDSKKLHITYNDLSIDRDKVICTDLYYGLSMDKIVKMSKLVYLHTGLDEDTHQECFFLTFLGIDNYLRSYMYLYGEWQQASTLLLGMKNLKILANNVDIYYFHQLENSKNSPIPCLSNASYLSYLPASREFVQAISKHCEALLPIFNDENT